MSLFGNPFPPPIARWEELTFVQLERLGLGSTAVDMMGHWLAGWKLHDLLGCCWSCLPSWLWVAEELLEKLMSHRGSWLPDLAAVVWDGWLPDWQAAWGRRVGWVAFIGVPFSGWLWGMWAICHDFSTFFHEHSKMVDITQYLPRRSTFPAS